MKSKTCVRTLFSIITATILLFSNLSHSDQYLPIDVVDFQQYNTYQTYLKKEAKHTVFVVSENMQPGSGYGWANTIEEATKYAKDACKERFRWDCVVVSVDRKITSKKRRVPENIKQPATIAALNIDDQPAEIKKLFTGYPFTNMYTKNKSHKAFAVNNFGATGQGHGKGYITEDIAKEKAIYHCTLSATRRSTPKSKQQPCHVVAVNERLLTDNIKKVLAQTETLNAADIGSATKAWHGKYNLDLSEMVALMGVNEGEKIYYLFGDAGFQIKRGNHVIASGKYKKSGRKISLSYETGEDDPLKRNLVLGKDQQSMTFDNPKYAKIKFIKE